MAGSRVAPLVGAGTAAALGVLAVVLHLGPGVTSPDGLTGFVGTNAVTAVSLGAVGAVVLRARPRHPVGRLLVLIALCHGVTGTAREAGLIAYDQGAAELAGWLLWAGSWPYLATLWFPLLLLLLPDGRPPGRRWRAVVVLAAAAPLPIALAAAVSPGPSLLAPLPGRGPAPDNPLGLVDLPALFLLSGALFLACGLAALVSLAVRWRRGGEQRQQLKWIALAGSLVVLGLPVEIGVPSVAPLIGPVAVTALAVAVGLAVVRYRLLDVDVVVSRAAVYAALTTVLVGLYVSGVTLLGGLLRTQDDVVSGVVAAGLVAAVFAPLRDALQRGVDRLLYGMRAEPYAVARRVLDAVDRSPSSDDVLPQLSSTVASALRLPWARVELTDVPAPADGVALPLHHRGTRVGVLLLGSRPGAPRLTGPEERLLADLTRQAGAAAHAVRLTRDLAASRDRLVEVREQERRRLRRDLHDGLGPLLAAITVQLDAALRLLADDPARTRGVLQAAKDEVRQAVVDVRRLLEDLRPESLDDAGLPGAVRALADRLVDAGLVVDVAAPEQLALPAEVETAAYRIVAEALTNVVRHAEATRASVELHLTGGELVLVVRDDGLGLPQQPVPGVGLGSMQERAESLGGTVEVSSQPGRGTAVRVDLPVPVPA